MIDKLLVLLAQTRRTAGERGASAVEYGLLIAGIAALVIVGVLALGPTIQAAFEDTEEDIADMAPAAGMIVPTGYFG